MVTRQIFTQLDDSISVRTTVRSDLRLAGSDVPPWSGYTGRASEVQRADRGEPSQLPSDAQASRGPRHRTPTFDGPPLP